MRINPKVSVIIPVYNVETYLEKCVESVLNQTFRDMEIIVVNDGSTDNSRKILEEIKSKDDRIIIFDKKNEGLSSARNAGIDMAKGEYLAFIDSDDWVDERYIEKMYHICVQYDCDIVQCSYMDVFDNVFQLAANSEAFISTPSFYTGKEFSYAMYTLLSWRCNLTWNKLYKKSLFGNIRFPHGKIHEDEFTIYKLIWKSKKIASISDKLYYYRRREGSIMTRPYRKERLDFSEAFEERELFFDSIGEKELLYLTKKRHLAWCLQQRSPLSNMKDTIEKEEIATYLENKEIELRQQIELLKEDVKIQLFGGVIFPFGKVPKGSSIILYGGGNIGRQYYRQVYSQDYCNIILWVDKNAEKCRELGIPVGTVEKISCCKVDWDYIVIAIENLDVVSVVIETLLRDYNIPANKIIYELPR